MGKNGQGAPSSRARCATGIPTKISHFWFQHNCYQRRDYTDALVFSRDKYNFPLRQCRVVHADNHVAAVALNLHRAVNTALQDNFEIQSTVNNNRTSWAPIMQCGMISLQATVQVKPALVVDNILQQIGEIEHRNIREAVSQTALSNQPHPEKWHLVQGSCKS